MPEPGYNEDRPFVFMLYLNNGAVYLFHCPTKTTMDEWTHNINLWAAKKSKEPFRSAVGSQDYGWGFIQRLMRANPETDLETLKDQIVPATAAEIRHIRIDEWTAPISGHLLSPFPAKLQLESLRKQVAWADKELDEHRDYAKQFDFYVSLFIRVSLRLIKAVRFEFGYQAKGDAELDKEAALSATRSRKVFFLCFRS